MMSKHGSKPQSKSNHKKQAATRAKTPTWPLILAGVVVVAIIAAFVFLNQSPAATAGSLAANSAPDEISVAEAAEKYEAGVFLLDVRTPEEWEAVHIPETTLIPLDELETRLNELPQGVEIVVVCRSGNRSAEGRDILRNAGFTDVTSMAGGINDWKSQGLPTVSGS
jgi:phage shock protein E